jgi:hypothetical protein
VLPTPFVPFACLSRTHQQVPGVVKDGLLAGSSAGKELFQQAGTMHVAWSLLATTSYSIVPSHFAVANGSLVASLCSQHTRSHTKTQPLNALFFQVYRPSERKLRELVLHSVFTLLTAPAFS